jgi:hypothetical protein
MTVLEDDCLFQKAVLWMASATETNTSGERKVNSSKVEISVRWENSQQETTDGRGNTVSTIAKIWVDRDIEEGSILWLGKLRELPSTLSNLKKVVNFTKTPDIKGREFERTCTLAHHGDTLPDTF